MSESALGAPVDSLVGRQLGPLRLLAELGRGPTGVVYRALPAGGDGELAVKVFHPWLVGLPGFTKSLAGEMGALTGLRHPRVLAVLGLGEADDRCYLLRDLALGSSLAELLRQSVPLQVERALAVAADVAESLDAAHAAGLVHGALKPANVFVGSDDQAMVADFALARLADRAVKEATGGAVVGDPRYLSPEQIAGQAATPASDRYSFGVLLFELIAGRPPFTEAAPLATLANHLTQPPPHLSSVRAGLPEALDKVVAMALAKAPADRYRSCREMVRAVEAALASSEPVSASPAPSVAGRSRGGVLAIGLAALGLAALVLFASDVPSSGEGTAMAPTVPSTPTAPALASVADTPSPYAQPATATAPATAVAIPATANPAPTATATATATSTASPTVAPTKAGPGVVLLVRQTEGGGNDLYTLPLAGGEPAPLWSKGSTWNWAPAVSADGEWIALNTGTPQRAEIAVARRDGSQRRVVAPAVDLNWGSPWWLPDGRVAFGGSRPGLAELYAVPPEGGMIVQLTNLGSALLDVRIPTSPRDGDQLAFSGREGRIFRVFVLPSGGPPRAISPERSDCYTPAWSPDGRSIAFSGQLADGRIGLFVVAPDGGGLRHLAVPARGGWLCCPAWSEDGSHLAFVGDIGLGIGSDYGNLFVVPTTGGESRRLTVDGRTYHWRPAWLP